MSGVHGFKYCAFCGKPCCYHGCYCKPYHPRRRQLGACGLFESDGDET